MSAKHYSGISLPLLMFAQNYYQSLGFIPSCAPMTADMDIMSHTCPPGVRDRRFPHVDGSIFVASAEQSFLQMEREGDFSEGDDGVWLMALTPCYRDEAVLDRTHFNIFLKLELFVYDSLDFGHLARLSYRFWTEKVGIPVEMVTTSDGIDIMYGDLELGSFGTRVTPQGVDYVYGTGVAEPRGSLAIKRQNAIENPEDEALPWEGVW